MPANLLCLLLTVTSAKPLLDCSVDHRFPLRVLYYQQKIFTLLLPMADTDG
jgi:hypothetical protein